MSNSPSFADDDVMAFFAKVAQETLIKTSGIPFSIVHATQLFEFVKTKRRPCEL